MTVIDLRSDTVTRPTAAMRTAMENAIVGDDVYLEDPTVNQLQQRAAEVFEREAALFVPSGSMGNLICVKLHTEPGNEVILEGRSHIMNYEVASMSMVAGVMPRPIATPDGQLNWSMIEAVIRPSIYYCAQTGLVCLENTHNMAGGTVMPKSTMHEICDRAHQRNLPVHLDGARVFNAATLLGESVAELTRPFDSVMFCLSKGLGSPVGSMIVGSREFIERARQLRKLLGGGMRQVGVLAAAGLISLEQMTERLAADHANARLLAEGLAAMPGVTLNLELVQTNIVIFDISSTGLSTDELAKRLKQHGVLASGINSREMRMVTHYDVDQEQCQQALTIIKQCLAN